MNKTYYLLVSRVGKPVVYKRYPRCGEGERVYKLIVNVPDAPVVLPFWQLPAIEVAAPEAPSAPVATVSEA